MVLINGKPCFINNPYGVGFDLWLKLQKNVTSLNAIEIDAVFNSMFNQFEKLEMITSKLGNYVQVEDAVAVQVVDVENVNIHYFAIPGTTKVTDVLLKDGRIDMSKAIFKKFYEAAIRDGATCVTYLSNGNNVLIALS